MIDVKEILEKNIKKQWLDVLSNEFKDNINSAIKEIITEVLKEAADSAEPSYYTNYGEINEDQIEPFVYKKSITSVINKVKF